MSLKRIHLKTQAVHLLRSHIAAARAAKRNVEDLVEQLASDFRYDDHHYYTQDPDHGGFQRTSFNLRTGYCFDTESMTLTPEATMLEESKRRLDKAIVRWAEGNDYPVRAVAEDSPLEKK